MRTRPNSSVGSGEETRVRILESGLDVFAEKGFEGASTREIASRAGVPQGLLRYYFGNKLRLWKAAVDLAFNEVRLGLEVAEPVEPGEEPGIAAIRSGIRSHVRYVARRPQFARLMYEEGKRRGPRMRWIVDRHVKPTFLRIIPMIEHLQGAGRLPADIPPHQFAYALVGAINTIFTQSEECVRVTGIDPTDPQSVEAHARVVEFLFLGPPSNAPIRFAGSHPE